MHIFFLFPRIENVQLMQVARWWRRSQAHQLKLKIKDQVQKKVRSPYLENKIVAKRVKNEKVIVRRMFHFRNTY